MPSDWTWIFASSLANRDLPPPVGHLRKEGIEFRQNASLVQKCRNASLVASLVQNASLVAEQEKLPLGIATAKRRNTCLFLRIRTTRTPQMVSWYYGDNLTCGPSNACLGTSKSAVNESSQKRGFLPDLLQTTWSLLIL